MLKHLTTFERHAYRFRKALGLYILVYSCPKACRFKFFLRKKINPRQRPFQLSSSDKVVYFLGAGHKQIVIILSSTVAGLFAFNLICAQFTIPVDTITVLLKMELPHRNGTSVQCSRDCLKMHKRLQCFRHSTIPKPARLYLNAVVMVFVPWLPVPITKKSVYQNMDPKGELLPIPLL